MTLMTEVFDAWAADRLQKQPLPFAQPFPPQNQYIQQPQQPYAQAQPYQQPYPNQYQQVTVAYNYPQQYQELPAQVPTHPMPSPGLPSPGLPPGYSSPVAPPHAMPVNTYGGYTQPQGGAVQTPVELPAETLMAPTTPVPIRSVSTDVSSSSFALLARDLWGADTKIEKEEVSV